MKKSDIFWQTYLNLEKEVIEVSKYIFFTDEKIITSNGTIVSKQDDSQLEVFSPYIADLLVNCCVQIEAISKELYFDNGGMKERGDTGILFDVDCLKLIDQKWETHNKQVLVVAPFFNFTRDENRILRPLKEAHKKQGTYWEKAYQAVKHDRYSSLQLGNVKALIRALAALYLLNIYYRNDSWQIYFNDINKIDYSLGSSVFSVPAPISNISKLLAQAGNNPIPSKSPYVATCTDKDYQNIKKIQQQEHLALNEYLHSQNDFNDPDFVTQLETATENAKKNPGQRVIPTFELFKYRFNKKIPTTLPFEKRKSLLINSEEWNGRIYQQNQPLSPNDITEDNIQKTIDYVVSCWSQEIIQMYQKGEWIHILFNNKICKVYIPDGDITKKS